MAGVNKVILLGNLGRDPELSYTPGGMAVCKFSIATSKKKQDGTEVTSWHRLTAFGKQAEIIAQYVSKGQQLYVEGELSYGQYDKGGVTVYTTDIMVREFTLIGGASGKTQQNQTNGNHHQRAASQQSGQQSGQQYQGDDYSFTPPDDDVPF